MQSSVGAVTMLFTDIEGSSTWWDRDPSAMRIALQLHDDIVRGVVDRHGGQVFFSAGDGFGVAFATAAGAVAAACDAQRALAEAVWPETTPLAVRMGIHTGVAEERDGNFFGSTVNRAARVADAGHGGQVLLSGVTAALVGPEVELVDQGTFDLRGLREPERLWWVPIRGTVPAEFPPPRSSRAGAAAQPPLPTRMRFDSDVGFVGRARSVEQLVLGLQSAREGGSPVVLVSGEAGVGKTRLVAEVGARLHTGGATVLYGRCDQHGGSPFQPFAEALSALAETLDPPTARLVLAPHGGELVRLVPRLDQLVPGVAEPLDGDASGNRHRLFHAVGDALSALADLAPAVVLVIDDFHWADTSTTALLEHLAVSAAPPGLAVVVAFRSTDVPRATAVEDVLGSLRRRIGSTVVDLDGLTPAEVEAYVSEAAGHDLGPPDEVVADLYARTEGNPFFIRELVRHLVDTRGATASGARRSATGRAGIPQGVRELVRQRLNSLPTDTTELLEAAAMFGQDFDVRFVAPTLPTDVTSALARIEPAVEAGLVTEVAPGRFSFLHLLVRMAIYDALPPARRLLGHVAAARSIEAHGTVERHWPELAYHWGEAALGGHAREAVASAREAGERAIAAAAHDAAVDYLRSAAAHIGDGAGIGDGEQLEVHLRLAEALNMAGRLDEAESEFLGAADAARRAGRVDLLARAALGLGGDLPSTPPVNAPAIALVEEALARHPDPCPTRALLLCRLAERRHRADSGAARLALVDEALAVARGLGDDVLLARVMLSRVRALHGPDAMAEMLAISSEVDRIATLLPDDALAVRSAQVRMNACFVLGDLAGAVQAARITSVLAGRLRQPEYARLPLMWDAFQAMYQGRFEAGLGICERLQELLTRGRHSQTLALIGALVMPSYVFRGQAEVCYEMGRELDVSYRDALLAWMSAEAGALDRARHHLKEFGPIGRIESDSNWSWWQGMVGAATAASLCGDTHVLAEVREAIAPWADQHATAGLVTYLGSGHHHLGVVEAGIGNLDTGIEELRRAVVAHESIGARPFVALSRIELARTLSRRGGPGDAAEAVEARAAALETADQLGLASVIARA